SRVLIYVTPKVLQEKIHTNEEHIQLGVIMSEMLIERKPLGGESFDTDLTLNIINRLCINSFLEFQILRL
ncbi:21554_t:CDS:1, partial [Racocetra persica]